MQEIAKNGWIFEVENPDGNLLYMVAHADPIEAEKILRRKIKLERKYDIYMFRPADEDSLHGFKLSYGEIKGPM